MRAPLYIYVDPYLFEFYSTLHKSPDGIIEVKQQDKFYEDLKYILQLRPREFINNIQPPKKRLIFLLPTYRILDRRIDVRYRNHLDSQREAMVVSSLVRTFKTTLHNYILGAVTAGHPHGVKQADAIRLFLRAYNIEEEHIKFDSLKKSWDRSDEKKRFCEMIEKN